MARPLAAVLLTLGLLVVPGFPPGPPLGPVGFTQLWLEARHRLPHAAGTGGPATGSGPDATTPGRT